MKISRRTVIFAGVGAAGIIGVSQVRPIAQRAYRERAYPRMPDAYADDSAFDEEILDGAVQFMSIIAGHEFSKVDTFEIRGRLQMLVTGNAAWRPLLTWLHGYLNRLCEDRNSTGFNSATREAKLEAVDVLMERPMDSRISKAFALVSTDESLRRLAIRRTVPRLFRLYRTSGVPWRRRGYASWPGVPGDVTEYTRPGSIRTC